MAQGGISRSRVAMVAAVIAGLAVESVALLTTISIAIVFPIAIAVAVGVWFAVRHTGGGSTTAILTPDDVVAEDPVSADGP